MKQLFQNAQYWPCSWPFRSAPLRANPIMPTPLTEKQLAAWPTKKLKELPKRREPATMSAMYALV